MNWKQLVPLWVGILILALMGFFPPWTAKETWMDRLLSGVGNNQIVQQMIEEKGYHFILDAPMYCEINVTQLTIQWCIVGFLTYGLVKTFENKTAYTKKEDVL